ncbi:MAG: hypothetical protein ACKO96_02115 [Flammeovirgaceae bacterium]
MSQKVKVIDISGTHQTVNTANLQTVEIKDVGVNQGFSITIIDINGNSSTYSFIGRQPKR